MAELKTRATGKSVEGFLDSVKDPTRREDCRRVAAPTLVVTGEAGLDRVVPVESTATYLQFIAGARSFVLERTGHFGTITRPELFADIVYEFVLAGAASGALNFPTNSRAGVA